MKKINKTKKLVSVQVSLIDSIQRITSTTHFLKSMLLFFAVFLTFGTQLQAQIAISGGTAATGSYGTLSAAISALNGGGALTAPVIINVNAGHAETLTTSIIMTISGDAVNSITIQKSGAGLNPKLTSHVGTNAALAAAATVDGMFIMQGCDYVTIDGIDLADATSNTTATTQMEVGYGFYKTSATDGCQNNTIKNCSTTLLNASTGIVTNAIVSANATWTAVSTLLVPTSFSGTSSNNSYLFNTLSGGTIGISSTGYLLDLTNALCDQNNIFQNNTISNYGNTSTGSATGIQFSGVVGFDCSNNTITSASVIKHAGTINGIFNANANVGGSGTIANNTITIHGGGTNQNIQAIRVQAGLASSTITINNNTITGCTYTTLTTSSTNVGGFNGILTTGIANYVITNNTLTNNNIGTGSVTTSGFSALITHNTGVASSVTITGNTITGNTYGSATTTGTGNFKGIDVGYAVTLAIPSIIITGNTIRGLRRNGTTGGTSWGIHAVGSATATTTLTVSNNIIDSLEINGTVGTSGAISGIQLGSSSNLVVDNNMISNLLNNKPTSAGAFFGIQSIASPTGEKYRNNNISNMICLGPNTIIGMNFSTAVGTREVSGNTISNLLGGGAGAVSGIVSALSTPVIKNNTIYNIGSTGTAATASSAGLTLTSISTGANAQIHNNMIYDIRANPTSTSVNAARGLVLGGASNTRFNTVYLNNTASTTLANNAGSCAISVGSTGILQNNIANNQYSSSGTGVSAVIRRTLVGTNGTAITTTSFGNNIYYQAPGTNNFVYAEGTLFANITNSYFISGVTAGVGKIEDANFNSACGLYKAFMTDAGTFEENNLLSVGVWYAPSGASFAESAANTTSTPTITDDISGTVRAATPDMGALEFAGSATDATPPTITFTDIPSTICTTDPPLSSVITDASGIDVASGTTPRLWYKKSTEADALLGNTSADNGWKYVEAINTTSPFQFSMNLSLLNSTVAGLDVIQYFVSAQDVAASPNVASKQVTFASGYCPVSVALDVAAFPTTGIIKSFSFLLAPLTVTTVASKTQLCITGNVNFSLTGDASTGAFYQWQRSPTGANTWTDIAGANAITYASTAITASTDFRCEISCEDLVANGGTPIAINNSTPITVNVSTPSISSTTPASRCGVGTVTLGAIAAGAGSVKWYLNPTGGTSVATSNTFTTPSIASTTDFYVSSSEGGLSGLHAGAINNGATSGYTLQAGLLFNATTDFILEGVHVYPIGTGAGVINIALKDAAGVVQQSIAANITASALPGVKTFIPLNWTVPTGTGYWLDMPSYSGAITSLIRDVSSAIVGGPIATNPSMTIPGVMTITSGRLGLTGTSTTYYFFYDWLITTGCESARIPVTASVIAPPSLTVSGGSTNVECATAVLPLTVTSTIGDFDSYIWTPSANLYTDAAGTIAYTGTSETTLYAKGAPAGVTTYTLNANNTSSGCSNIAFASVSFLPPAVTISGVTEICISGTTTLSFTPTTGVNLINVEWSNNAGVISGVNTPSYMPPTLTASNYYVVNLKDYLGNSCFVTPNYNVTVNNPTIVTTTPGTRCGVGTVLLGATGSAGTTLNWYATPSGGGPIGTGTSFTTPSIASTTNFYVAASIGSGGISSPTMPPLGTPFSGNVRGYWFVAPSNFTITSLSTPGTGTTQSLAVMKFTGNTPPPAFSATTNAFTTEFLLQGSTNVGSIPVSIPVLAGEVIGVFGQKGILSAYSSLTGPQTVTIDGFPVTLTRMLMQFQLPTTAPQLISTELSGAVGVVNFEYITGCESARVPVSATVIAPPALTIAGITGKQCSNTIVPVTVSSTIADYDSYIWSPITDLYTDAAATIPYIGTSETVLYAKGTTPGIKTWTLTASNSTTSCNNVATTNVDYLPSSLTINGGANLCVSGNVTLSYSPTTSITATNIQWNDASGVISGATGATFVTPTLTASNYYNVTLKDDGGNICLTTSNHTVNVNNPMVTTTTPGTRCGPGTVILEATTTSPNAILKWYSSPAGGASIGTGSPFTTPSIASATNFYLAAVNLGGTASGGRIATIATGLGLGAAPRGVSLTAIAPTIIDSFGVMCSGLAGTFTAQLYSGTNTATPIGTAQTFTIPANGGTAAAPVLMMFPSSFVIPSAGSYRLFVTAVTGGSILNYETNGIGYPYSVGPDLSIIGSVTSFTAANSLSTYYYFYKLVVQSECISPLSTVAATTNTCNSILNLTALIEGYVNQSLSPTVAMRPVLMNQGVAGATASDCDTITVSLHDVGPVFTQVATTNAVLNTSGAATCTFPPLSGSYYIRLTHRNSIQTWSASQVAFSSTPASYNFTSGVTQAAGSNMVDITLTGVYAIYSGDYNQDGGVENGDYVAWETDANDFASGYYNTDFNGDGGVENGDFVLWDNNASNFVGTLIP